jgi:hypothetical protein
MAKRKTGHPDHPLLSRPNNPDAPKPLAVFIGYLGPSPNEPDRRRLYTALDFRSYYTFADAQIVATSPTVVGDPNSATRVYVYASEHVTFDQESPHPSPVHVRKSHLQGDIVRRLLAVNAVQDLGEEAHVLSPEEQLQAVRQLTLPAALMAQVNHAAFLALRCDETEGCN